MLQRCPRCERSLPLDLFFPSFQGRTGNPCRACQKIIDHNRNSRPEIKRRRRELDSRPEATEKAKQRGRRYYSRPEIREKKREWNRKYSNLPENKERKRKRESSDDARVKVRKRRIEMRAAYEFVQEQNERLKRQLEQLQKGAAK
jgi:hypothetical protein